MFLIKMRGLPSLYDQRFARYRVCPICPISKGFPGAFPVYFCLIIFWAPQSNDFRFGNSYELFWFKTSSLYHSLGSKVLQPCQNGCQNRPILTKYAFFSLVTRLQISSEFLKIILLESLDTSNYIISEKSGNLGENSLHKFFENAKF